MIQQFITSDHKIIQTIDNKIFIVQKNHKEENKMFNKFQFRILTGATEDDCMTEYENLAQETSQGSGVRVHDPYTFYLFDKGGIGYLGDTPLFGGDASKFNMLGANTTYNGLKPNSFYFITADCTITDGLNPVVDTHTCKAGSIWITNANSVPSEISWTNFTTYMARYITANAIQSDGTNLPSGESLNNSFNGSDTTILTSAATKTLINSVINAQSILQISFFKDVKTVTITDNDIASDPKVVTFQIGEDPETHNPITATAPITSSEHEGDVGLVFQVQYGGEYDESDNDGDGWVFVNLHRLINLYSGGITDTTVTTIENDSNDSTGHTKKISVAVNKSNKTGTEFESLLITSVNNAVDTVVNHMQDNTNPDYDPTSASGDNLSSNKFISESQLADILAHVLVHFATVTWGSGDSIEEDPEEL